MPYSAMTHEYDPWGNHRLTIIHGGEMWHSPWTAYTSPAVIEGQDGRALFCWTSYMDGDAYIHPDRVYRLRPIESPIVVVSHATPAPAHPAPTVALATRPSSDECDGDCRDH